MHRTGRAPITEPPAVTGSLIAPSRPSSAWLRPAKALLLAGLALGMALFMSQLSAILVTNQANDVAAGSGRLREGGDSYLHWFALRALREGRNPYSPDVTQETQLAVWGRSLGPNVMAFVYPLPSLIWYLPMNWLDLATASAYARLLGLAGLLLSLVLGLRLTGVPVRGWPLIAGAASLASMGGVYDQQALGQNASVALALALGAALLYRRGRYALAGLALALALAKPHHVLIVAAGLGLHALWARARWGFFLGAGLGIGLPTAGSLLVSPGWVGQWLERLSRYSDYNFSYLQVTIGDAPLAIWLARVLVCLPVMAFWWWHRHDSASGDWFRLAVTGGLAASMVALTANPSLYNVILVWPALSLLLLTPMGASRGFIDRLARAVALAPTILVPLSAGLIALIWLLIRPGEGPSTLLLAQVALVTVLVGLYQGWTTTLWLLARLIPTPGRTQTVD